MTVIFFMIFTCNLTYLNYAKQNPLILFEFLKAISGNYGCLIAMRWILNAPKLFEQTIRLLVFIKQLNKKSEQAPIMLTHDEVALILNADRSSVSLVLEKLKKEGMVEIGYRKTCLKDSFTISKLRQEVLSIWHTTYYI